MPMPDNNIESNSNLEIRYVVFIVTDFPNILLIYSVVKTGFEPVILTSQLSSYVKPHTTGCVYQFRHLTICFIDTENAKAYVLQYKMRILKYMQ